MLRRLAPILTLVAVAACATTPDVPPELKAQVERLADAGACEDLQALFDGADYRGDADAMAYIDDALEAAGCYQGKG